MSPLQANMPAHVGLAAALPLDADTLSASRLPTFQRIYPRVTHTLRTQSTRLDSAASHLEQPSLVATAPLSHLLQEQTPHSAFGAHHTELTEPFSAAVAHVQQSPNSAAVVHIPHLMEQTPHSAVGAHHLEQSPPVGPVPMSHLTQEQTPHSAAGAQQMPPSGAVATPSMHQMSPSAAVASHQPLTEQTPHRAVGAPVLSMEQTTSEGHVAHMEQTSRSTTGASSHRMVHASQGAAPAAAAPTAMPPAMGQLASRIEPQSPHVTNTRVGARRATAAPGAMQERRATGVPRTRTPTRPRAASVPRLDGPGTLIWSGKLWVYGRVEELKVPVAAYSLASSTRDRPQWGDHLKCDPRGLETRDQCARLAGHLRSPAFALLRPINDAGEEIVDLRIEKVAEVIEERGAVFVGLHRNYFVMATRDDENRICLCVLYDQA